MVQGNTVRPLPSTISSTSSIIQGKARGYRGRGASTWLWSLSAVLFILCIFLLAALILVAKRGARDPAALSTRPFGGVSDQQLSNRDDDDESTKNKSVIVLPNSGHTGVVESEESAVLGSTKMAQRFASQLGFRLQKEIKPLLYKLELFPDLKTKEFTGTVEIDLEVQDPVPYIAIHSKQLQINNTTLVSIHGGSPDAVKIAATYPFDKFEYWVTEFEQPIEKGRYKFSLNFNGSLADRIVGLYASSYFSPSRNSTRTIATSKFEPTYARQAFPCFDEPAKKAEFEISIVRPTGDDYIALSNMNELSSVELDSELTRTTFNKSVPMSTYLACFIVCDFAKKAAVIESHGKGPNVELRVYATPHQLNKVDLALKAAKTVTERYIQYFDIAYPLPKLDLIAIPDFVSGAMEHWGLVTFRETALLYEKGVSSSSNKQRVVTVIAHELAHQWFGNLVTMDFWNDLWLNEGFASYIEYMGTEAAFPDWGMREQFLKDDFYRVIPIDASLATHPIVQNVSNPDQITEIFDAITYSKGATVIRMLEDIIGPENFRSAVSSYLNKHKYGNAITDDLLNEIEKLDLGMDIKVILDTWTRQGGLPVVNVERSADDGRQYTLTQKRFFSNPANEKAELPPSDFNYRWFIPVTYCTDASGQEVNRTWFPHTDSQLRVDVPEPHKWIKFNKDQMGYFLVNYSPDMWTALAEALKDNISAFSVSDRVQLLNDAFLLAEATQLEYKVALDMTRYLVKEEEYVPWTVAIDNLLAIRGFLYGHPATEKLRKVSLNLIENIYAELGWKVNDEEHLKNYLRSDVLQFACRFGHEQCLDAAKTEFLAWLANPSQRPHPDIRSVIYNYGMEVAGNESTWKQVWELFTNELDAQEKMKLMGSLARVQDPSILTRFIKLAWDDQNVRRQDYFTCMASIAANRVGEPIVWDYVRTHWQDMVDRFGLNERYLGQMIPSITKRFSSEIRLKEMQDFFAKYPEAGAGARSRIGALQTVQKNINWLDSNLKPVTDWLNSNAL